MNPNDFLEIPQLSVDEVINTIQANDVKSLAEVEAIAEQILSGLPKINREAWRNEMSNMKVKICENPTTFDINEGLAKCQGYRERLGEMLIYAQQEYKMRKRCLEMLFDAVSTISKASSADKRKAEASVRYPIMVLQVEVADIFCKEIEYIAANMKSTTESISRQGSVMSMQIQLGERRHGSSHATILSQSQSQVEELHVGPQAKNAGELSSWDEL